MCDFLLRVFANFDTDFQVFFHTESRRFARDSPDGTFHFRWGTACSGTESPQFVLSAWLRSGLFKDWVFDHIVSCEIDEDKRRFIGMVSRSLYFIENIVALSRSMAWCLASNMAIATSAFYDLDLFAAGFSCVDLSPLKTSQQV